MLNKRSTRIFFSVLLMSLFSQGFNTQNYIVSIAVFVAAVTLFVTFRKWSDERESEIAGEAALYTISAYTIIATLVTLGLLIFKDHNPLFQISAMVIAYSATFLVLCYGITYNFKNEGVSVAKRTGYILFAAVLIAALVAYQIYLF